MLIDLPILFGFEPAPDTLEVNELDTSPALANLEERVFVIEITVPAKTALSQFLGFDLSLLLSFFLLDFFLFFLFHRPYFTELWTAGDLDWFTWLACTWIRQVARSQLFPFQLLFFLKFFSSKFVLDTVLLLKSCPAFVAAEATWRLARTRDVKIVVPYVEPHWLFLLFIRLWNCLKAHKIDIPLDIGHTTRWLLTVVVPICFSCSNHLA